MNEFELLLRKEIFPHWIIYTLLLSIVVLSVLKHQREVVFTNLRSVFFNPPSSVSFTKEEVSFFGFTNWMLLFNYFAVSALAIYMVLVYFENTSFWLMLVPMAYYFFQLTALFFVGLLSGEVRKLWDNILLLNFTSHGIGIIFIPILFVWLLNPTLSPYIVDGLFVLFGLMHLIRILRGVFLALRNKVLWYYIILYLCGLEIWPIIVVYMLLSPDFIG
ncbi:MAG TPA: DUF4271 domain-containing protein [Brumimicrobium sp.]|nr:DUF4271 domain-containing protein [Brumimicrobium sp.]